MLITRTRNTTHSTTHATKPCILLALVLAASTTAAFAAKSNQPTMPKNPAALLALAAQHNGLASPNLKPWHIVATYQIYDAKGNPTEKGTFQEWWAAPNKYKLSFDRSKYHLQILAVEKGAFISGKEALPLPEYLVQRIYINPVPVRPLAKRLTLHEKAEKFGPASLNCVEEIAKGLHANNTPVLNPIFPTYCVEPSNAILRVYGSYGQSLVEITGVGTLEGRYIPLKAVIFYRGNKYLTVQLDKGESAAQWNPALFAVPHGMHLEPNFTNVPIRHPNVIGWNILKGKAPVYPESAKKHELQGTVILSVLIGKDGSIHDAVVISAPYPSLASSALAAVTTWKYQPFHFRGLPVNVRTKINVVYSLSSMGQFGNGR